MSRILVTGGAGFIGSNLAKYLLQDGNSVRILDNFSTGKRENLNGIMDRIELIEGDIRSYHTVMKSLSDIDYVFHEAALPSVPRSIYDPITSNDVNIVGTLNLLQCSKDMGVKKFIFASSSSVYGDNMELPKRETMKPLPKSPYALTKLTGEHYCSIFYKIYGMPTISLRYFNVFGPNQDPTSQYSAFIPKIFKALKEKGKITVFGDGEQTRDFTYIENVVNANILSLSSNEDSYGEYFNVATGKSISVNEIIKYVFEASKMKADVEYAPPRTGDVRDSLADISKISSNLKYFVSVHARDGLKKAMAYYL
ncbi:TPA: LPS biosynthesis protein WbpP [candidate division WOR-3 bacterium]|uniref:LPS biosynthesis protein WbpP n=1 Tax=candidate division WOR-3 bacterium TaxID=2052148 RepID=A0A350HAG7_UNCW3|nr:LPS biosynthesis protein WbpP [candidate division WOR-3 bacterium]